MQGLHRRDTDPLASPIQSLLPPHTEFESQAIAGAFTAHSKAPPSIVKCVQLSNLPPALRPELLAVHHLFAVGDGAHSLVGVRAQFELCHHVLGYPLHLPQVVRRLVLLRVRLARERVVVAAGRWMRPMHHKSARVRQEPEVHRIQLVDLHDLHPHTIQTVKKPAFCDHGMLPFPGCIDVGIPCSRALPPLFPSKYVIVLSPACLDCQNHLSL